MYWKQYRRCIPSVEVNVTAEVKFSNTGKLVLYILPQNLQIANDRCDALFIPPIAAMFAETQGSDSLSNEWKSKQSNHRQNHAQRLSYYTSFSFLHIANNYPRPSRRTYIKPGSVRIWWYTIAATGVTQKRIWRDRWALLFHTRYIRNMCCVIVGHHCNTITHQQNCNMLLTIFHTYHTDIVKLLSPL